MTELATFEAHRTHLLNLAYRMLGEMAAAEDVVQEAWLRWQTADADNVCNPRAWLSTVTVRLALDLLRKLRARRETYVGPWLPEPILPDDMRAFAADNPAEKAELASDLSLALLHVLERLAPEERAAFILHDAFDSDYAEIAAVLGKTEAACRQLVSRARERVKADRPRFSASRKAHHDLLLRFARASASPDPREVAALLAPDAIAYSDGGGRVPAALRPICGAEKVGRFVTSLTRKLNAAAVIDITFFDINGEPGLVLKTDGALLAVLTIETDGERITGLYIVRNPDKLIRFGRAVGAYESSVSA
ncbi:MAG TPA: RNA polymerase sigma factor SigJ [Rhizomicrobium sp.]|jgi:RNA polymerase sigma-70 factor (ECF subfamily)